VVKVSQQKESRAVDPAISTDAMLIRLNLKLARLPIPPHPQGVLSDWS
jgi:hypothetical protein